MAPRPSLSSPADAGAVATPVFRFRDGSYAPATDWVAVEEPLELRLAFGEPASREARSVSITMRTPGHDLELAAGFLYTEGLLHDPDQVASIAPCGPPTGERGVRNVVRVELKPGVAVDLSSLTRHFYTTSSCGVCGKASLEALAIAHRPPLLAGLPHLDATRLAGFPGLLREAQAVFERTGGLHAAGLFDEEGGLLALREDVGRHNAVDKVIGSMFLAGRLPLSYATLMVSGRASFELVQKALVAGIPILAAVGAPSSLAVDLARSGGMTLVGFVRDGRFNVYAGEERLFAGPASSPWRQQEV